MDILNNSWLVGISTGILSGIIVYWIVNYLFSQRDEKLLAQSILSANREILYALRPEVSEKHMPSSEVVDSLRNATARKYNLESYLLYDIKSISEELIKEIMDSSFISSEVKIQHCNALKELSKSAREEEVSEQQKNERLVNDVVYKDKLVVLFSLIIAMFTGLFSLYAYLSTSMSSPSPLTLVDLVSKTVLPIAIIIVGAVMLLNLVIVGYDLKHKRLRKNLRVQEPGNSEGSSK
ncbi:hypothetical protein N480_21240 [Pseudoalteromonas luteoviolacea S2607]|uniref:hypothetical protein n=1 Tax=Pseudoalteromonas luteoviolacea TaxID=43657 RepID=UPI0007B0BDCE|nr:hypothetical protein [Pseudoalteromonas luteoviolacea]KZN34552.1 hypothetical protein N480_21240 [Pseudoalteromonas luteoviolacea S2607]